MNFNPPLLFSPCILRGMLSVVCLNKNIYEEPVRELALEWPRTNLHNIDLLQLFQFDLIIKSLQNFFASIENRRDKQGKMDIRFS